MGAGDIALTLQWPWLVLPGLGAIRVSTIVTAIAIAAIVLWRRRSPLLAVITVMAWVSVYEVGFNAIGAVMHGWSAAYVLWLAAALAGWVLLAHAKGVAPEWRLGLATSLAVAVWIALGFDSNSETVGGPGYTRSFSLVNEALNELSKTLLGAAYLVGALRRR